MLSVYIISVNFHVQRLPGNRLALLFPVGGIDMVWWGGILFLFFSIGVITNNSKISNLLTQSKFLKASNMLLKSSDY